MKRSTFVIPKMDCAAEEQMVRMRLGGMSGIERLAFDLPARKLTVYHEGDTEVIRLALDSLGLGAHQVGDEVDVQPVPGAPEEAEERRPLVLALAINATFFVGELVAGFLAHSMGLVADSLDMLADALVYAMSLAAVGGTMQKKNRIAGWSGYFQLLLAVAGLVEVARRFVGAEAMPDSTTMIVVAGVALLGNVATLYILSRARRGEAHMEASWIFTSNDVKVNLLVIASGIIVYATASRIPDLVAGGLIFLIVANGARKILALSTSR